MIRALAVCAILVPTLTLAQQMDMDHLHMSMMHRQSAVSSTPNEVGQSAFAAIQEIVAVLESDPQTDWTKVNIDALRDHLVDMDAVTLHARARTSQFDGGIRFEISGEGPVVGSIRRMVEAHATAMSGVGGWRLIASQIESGSRLDVEAPKPDIDKIKALGFFGLMAIGMHHQSHHLDLAHGLDPHH